VIPEGQALADMVAAHYEDILSFYGTHLGLRVARKHLGWYMDTAGSGTDIRRAVLTSVAPPEVLRLVQEAITGVPRPVVEAVA